jgi:hypothetical protein
MQSFEATGSRVKRRRVSRRRFIKTAGVAAGLTGDPGDRRGGPGSRLCPGHEAALGAVGGFTDTYAKSAQGTRAEDAVAWAAGELKKIYEA